MVAEIVSMPLASIVAVRLLACSAVLSWSSVLTVPLVPSPKVTLTAVPPLKEEKVKVLPLMPPTPAVRAAVKAVAVPVLPAKPSDVQRVAGAGDRQVGIDAGGELELAGGVDRGVGLARGGRQRRRAVGGDAGGLHAGGKIDRVQDVGDRTGLQIDRRVAGAVGDDVAALAGAGRNGRSTGRSRNRGVLEADDVAVDVQGRAVLDQLDRARPRWWCGPTFTVALPPPSAELRPRAFSRSALPVTSRSAPVELRSVTLLPRGADVDAVWPALVLMVAAPAVFDGDLDAAGEVDRGQQVADGRSSGAAGAEIDCRVAAAVGDDVAADARAGGTAVAAGAAPARNVMVLPLTVSCRRRRLALPTRPVAVDRAVR